MVEEAGSGSGQVVDLFEDVERGVEEEATTPLRVTEKALSESSARVLDLLDDIRGECRSVDARRRLRKNIALAREDPPPDDEVYRMTTRNMDRSVRLRPKGNSQTELPLREDPSNMEMGDRRTTCRSFTHW
ncbi:hypothetical protein KBD61_01165 [Patescibacteria group bacterium]|nr:hypothetical protein [Patescibacteria group bacterium]MBP9709618.1 hypothetical protein [Patescibacteria group bacterium]